SGPPRRMRWEVPFIMPVSLTCSGCKVTLKVRDELAGKKVKCPRCSTLLVVPKPGDDDLAPVEVVRDDRISSKPPKKKTSPRRDEEDEDDRTEQLEDDRPARKSTRRDEDDRRHGIREGRDRDR